VTIERRCVEHKQRLDGLMCPVGPHACTVTVNDATLPTWEVYDTEQSMTLYRVVGDVLHELIEDTTATDGWRALVGRNQHGVTANVEHQERRVAGQRKDKRRRARRRRRDVLDGTEEYQCRAQQVLEGRTGPQGRALLVGEDRD
jgi:hypothetical protein